ncbi:stress responsive A/B barrel domain protein [Geopyxis carbonaria]|nr:stress responsive A/B barrel domain protein [Geopyxis carbonaria]
MEKETPSSRVVHIVIFTFLPSAAPEAVQNIIDLSRGMLKTCIHPITNKPYIMSVTGGPGVAAGAEHKYTFVYRFALQFDHDWYMTRDAAHLRAAATVQQAVADGWMSVGDVVQFLEDEGNGESKDDGDSGV